MEVICSINGIRGILIIMLSVIIVIPWSSAAGYSTDGLALKAFKNGIRRDPEGVIVRSWNDSVHYCRWIGVHCSRRHVDRVTTLSLGSHGLLASLSPHIGNLTFLRALDLHNNSFHGRLPSELGRLSRLRSLVLSNNLFEGTFPINLTKCLNLEYLDVMDNKLEGEIPAQLSSLSKLASLGLGRNHFAGTIPASLGNLSSLTELDLSENRLEGGIPEDLGRITNLEYIALSLNNLTGAIPSSIYNLSALSNLQLMSNHLSGAIHPDIGLAFPRLVELFLPDNRFTGSIPVSLCNASNLVSVQLGDNYFTGTVPRNLGALSDALVIGMDGNRLQDDLSAFLPSLVNCTRLRNLIFSDNSIRGSFSGTTVGNLSSATLETFSFWGNQIHGAIPSEMENLANLVVLDVSDNRLTGDIPPSIGKLGKLQQLSLFVNELSGRIPSSLGNISLLSSLYLGDNHLFGEIPSSLSACENLLYLSLQNNNLSGTIPKQLFGHSLSPLLLNFRGNALTGSIPLEVGSMIKLVTLHLSNNKLSGAVPSTLAKCVMIENLRLRGNFFHGEIPTALESLKSLMHLDLSLNNFSGHIPAYLGKLPLLVDLNLSFNQLTGEVPKLGVFGNATAVSVEGNNYNLCGGIEQLNLPKCLASSTDQGKKEIKKKRLAMKIAIPAAIGTAALCLSMLALVLTVGRRRWRRRSRNNVVSSELHTSQFKRVSYSDLHKATGGFSETNIIGAGSYGTVYKGVLEQDGIAIAVKVFNLGQRGASRSFMSECKALRKVRHRNLVKILSACSSLDSQGNDFKALVYELMPQGSLEEWLHPEIGGGGGEDARERLDFQQRLNIAIDVATALQYLHSQQRDGVIVHSDLKPSNVLLDKDMTAHVSDFGLAKIISIISSTSSTTQTNESSTSATILKGSIGYVAPEYGVSGKVCEEGDVYSYGILLLEMFTGKRPTDDMFQDGLTLHDFVKEKSSVSLSDHQPGVVIMEIMDPHLVSRDEERDHEMEEYCMASVLRIGLTCSNTSPRERMEMGGVVNKLHSINNLFSKERKSRPAGGTYGLGQHVSTHVVPHPNTSAPMSPP